MTATSAVRDDSKPPTWEHRSQRSVNLRHSPDFFNIATIATMHLGCLGVLWVDRSWPVLSLAFFLYFVRAS